MKEGEDVYFDFSKEEKDHAIRFLLDAVIRSRGHCGFPSNQESYDEDVNIYLAHLLFAISTSAYQKLVQKYLVVYPSDLVNFVDAADDNYIKYFVYKINADNLLIHLGVFDDLVQKISQNKSICKTSENQFGETARSYYEQAARYNQRIYRKRTAVGDVLDKLARHFDKYRAVLQVTRKDFFHFTNQFKNREFSEFVQFMNSYEQETTLKEKQDAFLDLYLEWSKNRENMELKTRLNQMGEELSRLDPNFQFRPI